MYLYLLTPNVDVTHILFPVQFLGVPRDAIQFGKSCPDQKSALLVSFLITKKLSVQKKMHCLNARRKFSVLILGSRFIRMRLTKFHIYWHQENYTPKFGE